jgi:hypothetical protein
MNKVAALTVSILLFSGPAAFGQDAMKYGVKHLTVLAEDQKVRVLRYAPHKGDKTPSILTHRRSSMCSRGAE